MKNLIDALKEEQTQLLAPQGSPLQKVMQEMKDNLEKLHHIEAQLRCLKKTNIEFAPALIAQAGHDIFFPRTINLIQGKAGVHKSRLAQTIASCIIKKTGCPNDLLGFHRSAGTPLTLVYIDTERNLIEQFPYALQSILKNAGYTKEEDPVHFRYSSLLSVKREDRLSALDAYLEELRNQIDTPLFVILDVVTDCIEDFNKVNQSLSLVDMLNNSINEHDVTFLCVIHENPGNYQENKARGHVGTELMNKASTVVQIGFEKDANKEDTDLIKLKYLKCRSSAKPDPLYLEYCPFIKGLALADPEKIGSLQNSRVNKVAKVKHDEFARCIWEHFQKEDSIKSGELKDSVMARLDISSGTYHQRISEFLESDLNLLEKHGNQYFIDKSGTGNNVKLYITPKV